MKYQQSVLLLWNFVKENNSHFYYHGNRVSICDYILFLGGNKCEKIREKLEKIYKNQSPSITAIRFIGSMNLNVAEPLSLMDIVQVAQFKIQQMMLRTKSMMLW